ncbi:hypothetical protein CCACVL1_25515 [Corchorus capsularis]|uniref:TF-B3 domain-containing protein n=1 Tax=Corchorus capsularis TaxID=210143 RepID=A0A1R3GJI8_COCAP|nr:hypothetical protein CCACVL1_25515 [Corchorus capsularis]
MEKAFKRLSLNSNEKEEKLFNFEGFKKSKLPPPPTLPQEFKDVIKSLDGTNLVFLMQKNLSRDDLSRIYNRLSIPMCRVRKGFLCRVRKGFLSSKEKEELLVHCKKPVLFVEPSLDVTKMFMRRLEKKTYSSYVLVSSQWDTIWRRNNLKEGDLVQLWTFRVKENLGFALVRRAEWL